MNPLLSVKNLSVIRDGQHIIENLSFDHAQGEVLAVIGPNGAGKTMLLKALLNITPFQGSIAWENSARVGYVPQKIDADRHLPITLENLLSAKADILKLSARATEDALRSVGVNRAVLTTPVGHLSGGQFQKALIAFALLGDPNVILFDEPTASLDQLSEEHIYDLMHDLSETRGKTVILVSHDLSVVYRYATKVLCLNKSLVCFGAPQEVMSPDMLEKTYAAPHKYFHHL